MVHEVELARLALRRDALIAEYNGDIAWWQAVQGAGLAAAGLALVGAASGTLQRDAFLLTVAIAALAVLVAARRIDLRRARFRGNLAAVNGELARLKTEDGHL